MWFFIICICQNKQKKVLKDTLKASDDFKNKQEKCMNVFCNVFWYVKVYIFWKFI